MTITIGPVHYDSAVKALVGGNHRAATQYNTLIGKLGGFGGMAGDDSTSTEFAAEYDKAAKEGVDCLNGVVDSFATLAALTAQSVENHRAANQGSVYGRPPVHTGTAAPRGGPVDVRAYTPPSCEGGDNQDTPDFWNEILDHLEGFAWPNANTDRLRSAGDAWRDAGDALDGLTWYCEHASDELADQRSPEVPLAREAYRELKSAIKELATEFRSIGQACHDYASQVDTQRDTIKGIVRDMAIEAGISVVAGAVVGFFTFGGGAAAGGAIAGWRIASAARKILAALRALKAAARAKAVASLSSAAAKFGTVGAKLKKLAGARRIKKAADPDGPPPGKTPPRRPGDRLPDDDRPGSAGEDWEGRVADNGKGDVWQKPGATGNSSSVRVMEPTDRYPDGYVRYYNENNQPIGLDGKPTVPGGSKADNHAHTHIPRNPDGTYPVPKGWKP